METFEAAYLLNTWLLWFLVAVGAWNALSWVARSVFKEQPFRHRYSIFLGAWAALVLLLETL